MGYSMNIQRRMPAGDYIISDLCYVLSESDYDKAIELTGYFGLYNRDGTMNKNRDNMGGTFVLGWGKEIRKHPFAVWSTYHGDGGYRGTDGNMYSVDAGIIGCVPLALVDSDKLKHGLGTHFHAHTFDREINTWSSDGTLVFGDVTIYTGNDPDEPCEWCDELEEECEC